MQKATSARPLTDRPPQPIRTACVSIGAARGSTRPGSCVLRRARGIRLISAMRSWAFAWPERCRNRAVRKSLLTEPLRRQRQAFAPSSPGTCRRSRPGSPSGTAPDNSTADCSRAETSPTSGGSVKGVVCQAVRVRSRAAESPEAAPPKRRRHEPRSCGRSYHNKHHDADVTAGLRRESDR